MGNCCKPVKPVRKPAAPCICIEVLGTASQVPYKSEKPVGDLFAQLDLSQTSYSVYKGSSEILDYTATLRQLGITPQDTLVVIAKEQPSEDLIAEEDHSSLREPQAQRFVASVTRVGCRTMWHTAHSPSNNRQQAPQLSDVSSFATHMLDYSLKEREPPCLPFVVPGPFEESDESRCS